VLIARLDSLGDVLLAGPAVRAVAAGAGRVTFLASPRGRAAAELLPGVDGVIVAEAPWIDPEPGAIDAAAVLQLVARLADAGVDQAVVLTSFHQSALPAALLLRMAGVPVIAAVSDDYPGSLLDVRHRVSDDIHEVQRALSTVATLGYRLRPGDHGQLAVRPLPRAGTATSETAMSGTATAGPPGDGYVVVHPGASVPARAWSPARHAALVDALVAAGRRVVVTGAADERALTAIAAGPPRPGVADWGGRVDFAGLAAVLAWADVIVAGNTGPAHLAAAVGTPVVSLYAPTVPAVRWRPWGVPHVLLGDQAIDCAGCRARHCPVAGHPCLSSIPVDRVLAAVDELAPRPPVGPGPAAAGPSRPHPPEVLPAEVLPAEVLPAEVLRAEVLRAEVLRA
jgi:ADP-heptose:LPS heptosyltransferase